MDIQKMLENGTGFKWKELRYLKPPELPWFIYIDNTTIRGADILNNIIEHNLTLEYYYETKNVQIEKTIEEFLNSEDYQYDKNTDWLEDEQLYVTIYEINTFLEKIKKG